MLDFIEFAESISSLDFQNYKATISSPDANKWRETCNTEISTLIANTSTKSLSS